MRITSTVEPMAGAESATYTTRARTTARAAGALGAAKWHLALVACFSLCGVLAGLALCIEHMTPGLDVLGPRTFGALLSFHGMAMFYFVLLPAFPGVLGHAFLSRILGKGEMALPWISRASTILLGLAGALLLAGFVTGGTEAGWMFDHEFAGRFAAYGIVPAAAAVFLVALAQALTSMNILVTIRAARRESALRTALPPFVAALYLAGFIGIVAFPVLAGYTAVVIADRCWGLALFDPALGADPELAGALFRIFNAPAQNLVMVLALGVVVHILWSRTNRNDRDAVVVGRLLAMLSVVGAWAWPGTVTNPGTVWLIDSYGFLLFGWTLAALALIIAAAIRLLRQGLATIDTPAVYALGFLITMACIMGTGFMLAFPATGAQLGGTTFATAHLHVLSAAALGMAFLGGLHEVWSHLTGRLFKEGPAKGAAVIIVVGTFLAFAPMFVAGAAGCSFRANAYAPQFHVAHVLSCAGTTILLAGLVLACANLAAASRAETWNLEHPTWNL